MTTSSGSSLPPSANGQLAAKLTTARTMQAIITQIVQLPESLGHLKGPLQISGQVAARGPNNTVTINTAAGPIQVQDNGSLKAGQNVNITLQAGSPPAQADIRPQQSQQLQTQTQLKPELSAKPAIPQDTVTTQPRPAAPPAYNASSSQWGQSGQYPSAKLPLDIPLRLTALPPVSLQATLQKPAATITQAIITQILTPTAARLSSNVQMPLLPQAPTSIPHVISIPASILLAGAKLNQLGAVPPLIISTPPLLPSGTPAPAGATSLSLPANVSVPQATVSQTALPQTNGQQPAITAIQALPPLIAQQDVKIAAILPPPPVITQPAIGVSPIMNQNIRVGDVVAVVTGQTARGQPIIQSIWPIPLNSGSGTVPQVLNFPAASLLTGTQLVLKPITITNLAQTANPAQIIAWWKAGEWPLLTQAMASLNLTEHTSLLQQLASPTRMTPAALSGTIMLFLNALRAGDIGSFLSGDDPRLKALSGNKSRGVAGLLEADAQRSTRLQDNDGNNWRAIALPFNDEREISKVQLYLPERDPREAKQDNEGQRFVMAVNLSRMGELQFDGLYYPEKSLLDLVVRSEHAFTERMQTHLNMLYLKATSRSSLTGQIFFQLKSRHWLELVPEDVSQSVTQA